MFLQAAASYRSRGITGTSREDMLSILTTFINENARLRVNISSQCRNETIAVITTSKDRGERLASDLEVFNAAFQEIITCSNIDTWPRYMDWCRLRVKIELARQTALFWRVPFTFGSFFSFPDLVNKFESRLHAWCTITLIIINAFLLYFHSIPYLGIFICYGFIARTACGPRLDPQSFFVLFILRPLLEDHLIIGHSNFKPGSPNRFAQFLGMVFSLAATLLSFVFKNPNPSLIIWGIHLIASALLAVGDVCIGCIIFGFAVRMHVVNTEICVRCAQANDGK